MNISVKQLNEITDYNHAVTYMNIFKMQANKKADANATMRNSYKAILFYDCIYSIRFLNFDALKLKLDCTKAKKLMLRILTDLSKLSTH